MGIRKLKRRRQSQKGGAFFLDLIASVVTARNSPTFNVAAKRGISITAGGRSRHRPYSWAFDRRSPANQQVEFTCPEVELIITLY